MGEKMFQKMSCNTIEINGLKNMYEYLTPLTEKFPFQHFLMKF